MTYFWSIVDISDGADDLGDVVVRVNVKDGGQTNQREQL